MLFFEHIVQVNDFGNRRVTPITRSQLWQGLVQRARHPDQFNQGLRCESEAIADNQFFRTIVAGSTSFREKVVLTPELRIHTHTLAEIDQLQAESNTTIEEPELGHLFVRFAYRRDLEVNTEAVDVAEHLKAAYVQIDRDAIAMIRVLATSRLLDQPKT